MEEPLFAFKSEVRIRRGFFRGQVGSVEACTVRGFFNKKWVYKVSVQQYRHVFQWLMFEEDMLELDSTKANRGPDETT